MAQQPTPTAAELVQDQALLGTETFENVLFTPDTETPVDVRIGETPDYSRTTVDEAKAFAERTTDEGDAPRVAKATSVEQQVETQSKPYVSSVFCHLSMTGGLDVHKAYLAAWRSDDYVVDHEADYETGDLTITVTESGL